MFLSWVGEIEKELGWREAAVWLEKDVGRVASAGASVMWSIGSGEVFSSTCGENLVGRGDNVDGQGVQDKERQD